MSGHLVLKFSIAELWLNAKITPLLLKQVLCCSHGHMQFSYMFTQSLPATLVEFSNYSVSLR